MFFVLDVVLLEQWRGRGEVVEGEKRGGVVCVLLTIHFISNHNTMQHHLHGNAPFTMQQNMHSPTSLSHLVQIRPTQTV